MFFIGIFGIENKDKEIRELNNLNCKKCNNTIQGKLIKNFDFFHFFFIPLFKWNEKYYVVCNRCKCLYSITKEKGKAIESGEDINITYWDLQEVYSDNNINFNNNSYDMKRCSSCGEQVKRDFKYCPYCGKEI
ncbi:zinc-ribbon domain-containing protein [Clostridium sp. C2-6-12]|uniref:zinc-ribbon domain-containing protein n=1 Tax=Clostridium sp. C2-6-12 TaxID=2698832 RepID=UPI00136D6FB5|nr:zinc-ribbon domain-containing protein [Clostridium sp. C2-6-12]